MKYNNTTLLTKKSLQHIELKLITTKQVNFERNNNLNNIINV